MIPSEISQSRFEYALSLLRPSDWERFERVSSTFLASDWKDIRTMAASSGDGGRDSELFAPEGTPSVAIQYSVRKDWDAKIRETVRRLNVTFPDVSTLVFTSNQVIGAAADAVRKYARENGVFLDIRDRSWFVERVNSDAGRVSAATELARVVVDPLLEVKNVARRSGEALSQQEARTALVFLEMQLSDEKRGKGLTRSVFESLVKGVLCETTSESRMPRAGVHAAITKMLPKHPPVQLTPYIDSALLRLSKAAIRHWPGDDTFCISYQEAQNQSTLAARIQILNDEFDEDALEIASSIGVLNEARRDEFLEIVRTAIGKYFLKKGEEFASAIAGDSEIALNEIDIREIIVPLAPKDNLIQGQNNVSVLMRVVNSLFSDSSVAIRDHLRLLSDSYTLFAFLEETPDVQKATRKLFGQADIWLDTSVLLPVFAEVALPETMRPFTAAFKQARKASISVYVTQGIVEEIERHLNVCIAFARSTTPWKGRVPYVIAQYLLAGGKVSSFSSWVEQFVGQLNPEQDIADYLREEFAVEVRQGGDDASLDKGVVYEVEEYWRKVQDRRRNSGDQFNMNANRLAAHDAENYLLVLRQRKKDSGRSPLGFTSWWLTMDHAAWKIPEKIDPDIWREIKHSPLMSIDFLLKYLAFGPNRERVDPADLPYAQIFTTTLMEVPADLLDVAEEVRTQCGSLPERIIQRRIRDAMDMERAKAGPVQDAGLDGATTVISELF